jgi:hypothetical protein
MKPEQRPRRGYQTFAVALHRRERLSKKTTKVLFYLYSDFAQVAGIFFVVLGPLGTVMAVWQFWPLFHH